MGILRRLHFYKFAEILYLKAFFPALLTSTAAISITAETAPEAGWLQ